MAKITDVFKLFRTKRLKYFSQKKNPGCTTNGMCAKNSTYMCSERATNNKVTMSCDLYCCLLLQTLRACPRDLRSQHHAVVIFCHLQKHLEGTKDKMAVIFRQNRCKQSLPPHPRRAHYQLNCRQRDCFFSLRHFGDLSHSCVKTRRNSVH